MTEACHESCRFLLLESAGQAGTCPSVSSLVTSSSPVSVCARDCETDEDCDATTHKCCADGCDRHCRPAIRRFHDGIQSTDVIRYLF